jgi:hypothetical protein
VSISTGVYKLSKKVGVRVGSISAAVVVASASLLPLLVSTPAQAAQMTRRRVEMSTSVVGVSATGDFMFQFASGTVVTGIEIEFVDTPLGTYAGLPSSTPTVGGSPTATILDSSSTGTLSGTTGTAVNGDTFRTWDDTGAFAASRQNGDGYTGGGSPNNQIQLTRTSSTTETSDATTSVHALRIAGLTNNATTNTTFFARVRVYSSGTSTLAHDGTVAGATTQVLSIQARVQEVLQFCIGAETATNISAWTGAGTSCASVSSSLVDLGPVDSGALTVSPDPDGNDKDGIAMLRTNAVNGATITYKSLEDLTAGGSNRGSLKIVGQTCSSTDISSGSKTDKCFNDTLTGNALTSTEGFGMKLIDVDTASETPTANLTASSPYSGATYSWDDTGASVLIASSTGASEKVVDDEAFRLRFAAHSALTTPTGQYSVQAQFIAVVVY